MINESKNYQYLYHFVNNDTLERLLRKNFKFHFGPNESSDEPKKYFLSLTRKYDFQWSPYRFTFDAKKLSENFIIKPIHYFNKEDKGMGLPDYRNNPYYGEEYDNQYEERCYSNKQDINLSKYILQIDLEHNKNISYAKWNYSSDNDGPWDLDYLNYLKSELDDKGYPTKVVKRLTPFNKPWIKSRERFYF